MAGMQKNMATPCEMQTYTIQIKAERLSFDNVDENPAFVTTGKHKFTSQYAKIPRPKLCISRKD